MFGKSVMNEMTIFPPPFANFTFSREDPLGILGPCTVQRYSEANPNFITFCSEDYTVEGEFRDAAHTSKIPTPIGDVVVKSLEGDVMYEGPLDKKLLPSGNFCSLHSDTVSYRGGVVRGFPSGPGVMTVENTRGKECVRYCGTWIGGHAQGHMEVFLLCELDGRNTTWERVFSGNLYPPGLPHGEGIDWFTILDGEMVKYMGPCRRGQRHGQGIFCTSAWWFEGEFDHDVEVGGTMYFHDGLKISFRKRTCENWYHAEYPNGDIYVGEMNEQMQRHGTGSYKYKDGKMCTGVFEGDRYTGETQFVSEAV